MPSSGMWHRADLVWTDVSEERIAPIFRIEKSASEEAAWAGGSMRRQKHQRQEYHTWHKDPRSWSEDKIQAIRNSLLFKRMQEPSSFVCVTCYSFGDPSLERECVQHCIVNWISRRHYPYSPKCWS
jgi:hypothetical protein